MSLKKLWQKLKSSPSANYPHFKISPDSILDNNENLKGDFESNKHYFEIRLVRQFLKDKREYWNEYNPISIVLTEFSYAGGKKSFPFVVGPKLLAKLEEVKTHHQVSYVNTRVVGPTPYVGDQIALFTGLFRLRTRNWAIQALNLLQSFASSFDASKLTKYINISTPLMEGVENFIGMEDMELRLAQRIEYTDSSIQSVNKFQPGYWVMIRTNSSVNKDQFSVKDNKLYFSNKHGNLEEYISHDYIIYSIEKLEKRNDYTEFDFHKILKDIKAAIWDGNAKKSKDLFHSLFYTISVNEDLTHLQKNELQIFYKNLVKEEIEKYKTQKDEDSMFDFGENANVNESANKYALTIKRLTTSSKFSLDDMIETKDEKVINQRINDYLNSNLFQSSDLNQLNSRVLASKLYENILKL